MKNPGVNFPGVKNPGVNFPGVNDPGVNNPRSVSDDSKVKENPKKINFQKQFVDIFFSFS